jgi:hypothetical protein
VGLWGLGNERVNFVSCFMIVTYMSKLLTERFWIFLLTTDEHR